MVTIIFIRSLIFFSTIQNEKKGLMPFFGKILVYSKYLLKYSDLREKSQELLCR